MQLEKIPPLVSLGRDDISIGGSIQPHRLYSPRPRNGTQAVPYGFADGWYRSSTQVLFATFHGDESSPLHRVYRVLGGTVHLHKFYLRRFMAMNHRRCIGCTVYWVVPFIHTVYIRNVAGGMVAAPTGVAPFIRTGCLREVHGGMVAAPTGDSVRPCGFNLMRLRRV